MTNYTKTKKDFSYINNLKYENMEANKKIVELELQINELKYQIENKKERINITRDIGLSTVLIVYSILFVFSIIGISLSDKIDVRIIIGIIIFFKMYMFNKLIKR